MDIWTAIQDRALQLDPTLTGDQLDRVGNLTMSDSMPSDATLRRAIKRVRTTLMEK